MPDRHDDPSLAQTDIDSVLAGLLAFWAQHASNRGIRLLGMKDVSDRDRLTFGATLEGFGLRRALSLPTASMRVDFDDVATYFARLSSWTRKAPPPETEKSHRRAGRAAKRRRTISGADHLYVLETRERSDWSFETLSDAYFPRSARQHGPQFLSRAVFSSSRAAGRRTFARR